MKNTENLVIVSVRLDRNGWQVNKREINLTDNREKQIGRVDTGISINRHRFMFFKVICLPDNADEWIEELKGKIKIRLREISADLNDLLKHI